MTVRAPIDALPFAAIVAACTNLSTDYFAGWMRGRALFLFRSILLFTFDQKVMEWPAPPSGVVGSRVVQEEE
jgi:hypothetical protein